MKRGHVRIVKVDEDSRREIIKRLSSNLLHNLFVVYDLLYEPDKTTMYVAYGNDGLIKGHLLIYRGLRFPSVRVDGEARAVSELLELLPREKMLLFCPPKLLSAVKRRFPNAPHYLEDQMCVSKEEEHLISSSLAQKLGSKHASLLTELYSSGEPSYIRSEERCRELLTKHSVFGVFIDGKLVSVAVAMKRLPQSGELTGVFTHPRHRGRGFGTIVTSAATEEALKHADNVLLYVRSDNVPAKRIYRKLGYRKIDEWYWVDIGTGLKP